MTKNVSFKPQTYKYLYVLLYVVGLFQGIIEEIYSASGPVSGSYVKDVD